MEQELLLSPAFARRNPLLRFSPPRSYGDYSSFSPRGSVSPMTASSDEANDTVDSRLYLAGLSLQRQDFLSRYELCLSHLHDAAREADALRLENTHLRALNTDLARRLADLSATPKRIGDLEREIRRMRVGDAAEASPTSVLQAAKVALPKSISVRSAGYKKVSPEGGPPNRNGRTRVSGQPQMLGSQRVYVGGGSGSKKEKEEVPAAEKEEEEEGEPELEGLELEVYNQGVFKTELCNKWQESGGKCPYADNCQFAHGIAELRPVIRHPRYKTEICRMVLAGDPCPYGHRCHFRHALSPNLQL